MKLARSSLLGAGAAMLGFPSTGPGFPEYADMFKAGEANIVPLVRSGLLKPE